MTCKNCGRNLDDTARYCDFCGAHVDIESIKGDIIKRSIISLVLSAIAIILACTCFVIFAFSKSGSFLFASNLICIITSVKAVSIALKNIKQVRNVLTVAAMIISILAFLVTAIFTMILLAGLLFVNLIELIFKAGSSKPVG